MLFYEFTRWWTYRRIEDATMRHYVWTVPLCITLLSFAMYYVLPIRPQISGDGGLLDKASQALTLLPGFFITALAAVATFNRPEMDETMPSPAPRIKIAHRGNRVEIELTRRLFLSYLFSYLSILSFFLFAIVSSAPYILENLTFLINLINNPYITEWASVILKNVSMAILVYFFTSLVVTMLHGIYFLCERIHMPNT
ncbi:hypothetical protein [Ensifer sp. LCM 4579]|uniref:hypothetical protein n=1 Tax=Ensifer sp. LCM 4579 TaxID=1848292 RepID=UPI0008DA5F1B|nr:hypothetical protein [Ensifer sp. LCM 4579]OHV83313.1 hypothetical protein LCM4579_16510 [Ensifer sp. LCM 4579]